MAKKPFWWDLITATISMAGTPLTLKEIWNQSAQYRIDHNITTEAKSPIAVLYAHCYGDISQNGNDSKLIKMDTQPARYYLRELAKGENFTQIKAKIEAESNEEENEEEDQMEEKKTRSNERDLHPFLAAFAINDSHFNAHLKTVYHEKTDKNQRGLNEWLHPDIVGVYFSFQFYEKDVSHTQKSLSINGAYLYSFEMKWRLKIGNLRKYYFQAVSNSSWANEGYLVARDIDYSIELNDELERLNNAFGIGVIQLIPDDLSASVIVHPAKMKPAIDWDTANKLAKKNPDFRNFLSTVARDWNNSDITNLGNYDKIESEDTLSELAIKLPKDD